MLLEKDAGEQLDGRYVESGGQAGDDADAGVSLARLDPTNLGRVHVAAQREGFLREAPLLADASQVRGEDRKGIVHARSLWACFLACKDL